VILVIDICCCLKAWAAERFVYSVQILGDVVWLPHHAILQIDRHCQLLQATFLRLLRT